MDTKTFIEKLPKAELHLHIEGTLEPELMLALSKKNNIQLPYKSLKDIHQAYEFDDLQSFLDLYYLGAGVLCTEQDFYDLTWAYLNKAKQNNITHTEIFFDPQTHTERGIAFETVIEGIYRALKDAEKQLNISHKLIMCFLRHLPEESALETLEQAMPYQDWIIAVGLDSAEVDNPPTKFKRVFEKAISEGFLTVAHAGEEGPADYIWQAINELQVSRVDHGIRASDDPKLIQYLKENHIPLTVCPLSNVKLKVFESMAQHNLPQLIEDKLLITINSDDPAYFGGYLNENYLALHQAFDFSHHQFAQLAKNSFEASFISDQQKKMAFTAIDQLKNGFEQTG